MKILRVAGKNLASLSKFDIDFRKLTGGNNEVFAIIGDTGAGKSTILDAICLGLYASTPRIAKGTRKGTLTLDESISVSTADNIHIMTRGQTSCFAEVDFVGRDGELYRSRYEIGKKRIKYSYSQSIKLLDKAGNPVKTVAETKGSQKQLEEGIIVSHTGLSWSQFSKIIILPQGDFTAFLDETPENKIALLEKLTGTEIYKSIDDVVHDRIRSLNDKRKELKLEMESIKARLLQDEEIAETQCQITLRKADLDAVNARIKAVADFTDCQKQADAVKNSAAAFLQQEEELKQELNALQNENRIITLYDLASPLRALHAAIDLQEKSRTEHENRERELNARTPELQIRLDETRKTRDEKKRDRDLRLSEREARKPELARAEALTQSSAEFARDLKNLAGNIEAENKALAKTDLELKAHNDKKSDAEVRRQKLEADHEKDSEYQDLLPVWNDLNAKLPEYRSQGKLLDSLGKENKKVDAAMKNRVAAWEADWQQYHALTQDSGTYSFTAGELPPAAPLDAALEKLEGWHGLSAGIRNNVSALLNAADYFLNDAAGVPGRYQACLESLEILAAREKDLKEKQQEYAAKEPALKEAEQLEKLVLETEKEKSGLEGRRATCLKHGADVKKRLEILKKEEKRLETEKDDLKARMEQDQKWQPLASSWNDLYRVSEKYRMLNGCIAGYDQDIKARNNDLTALENLLNQKFQAYQDLVLQESGFASPGDAIPSAAPYTAAQDTLKTSQKMLSGLDALIRDTDGRFRNFLSLTDVFSETCAQASRDNDELRGFQGEDSPIARLENRINELNQNIGVCKVAEQLKEAAFKLKPGDACPCCGSREHPGLDGSNTEISVGWEKLIRKLPDYQRELKAAENELKKQNEEKITLETRVAKYWKDLKKETRNIAGVLKDLAAGRDEIAGLINTLAGMAPGTKPPVSGIIAWLETLLQVTAEKGSGLHLLAGTALADISGIIAGYQQDLEQAKEYPVFDKTGDLNALKEDLGNAVAELARFRTDTLEKASVTLTEIDDKIRGVPQAGQEIAAARDHIEELNHAINDLQAKKDCAVKERDAAQFSGDEVIKQAFGDLIGADSQEAYQSRVCFYEEIAKRISETESALKNNDRNAEANERSLADSQKDLADETVQEASIADSIARRDQEIAEYAARIKELLSGQEKAQTCRDKFEKDIRSSENELTQARQKLNDGIKGLENLKELIERKHQDIRAEREKLLGNLSNAAVLGTSLPEASLSGITAVRKELSELSDPDNELLRSSGDFLAGDAGRLAEIVGEFLSYLSVQVSGAGTSSLAAAPAVSEFSEKLSGGTGCRESLTAYEASLKAGSDRISGAEKDLKTARTILRKAQNSSESYGKDKEGLEKIRQQIAEIADHRKTLLIETGSACIDSIWKELTAADDKVFQNRIKELEKTAENLAAYPGRLEKLDTELKGINAGIAGCQERQAAAKNRLQELETAQAAAREKQKEADDEITRITAGLGLAGLRDLLDKAVAAAEQDLKTAEIAFNNSENAVKNHQVLMENNARELNEIKKELSDKKTEMSEKAAFIAGADGEFSGAEIMTGLDITSEVYNGAKAAVKNVQDRLSETGNQLREKNAVLDELSKSLERYRAGLSGDDFTPEGELRAGLAEELAQSRNQIDSDRNELSFKLRRNDENLQQLREYKEKDDELYKNNEPLYQLAELFDKKKSFAAYAQTITFSYLMSKANFYIRSFTGGRYELKQAERQIVSSSKTANSLDIIVTDHYEGDMNRIVNSLSGGEKFRVALGLALGLSDLISSNIRVDNMFIDEGFDTLDNERLDDVITALSSITRRQIGIITHVDQVVNGTMIKSKIRLQHAKNDPSKSEVIMESAAAMRSQT
ncbi:MAG: AAA family ATPase [Succinimonas sp.]|nr:AAA family ATPase [Succinimonas sp.]